MDLSMFIKIDPSFPCKFTSVVDALGCRWGIVMRNINCGKALHDPTEG
jgi:hypothetical protein